MDKSNKKEIGDFGEKQAQKFLRKNKYKIVATNYRKKYGEIDIVAEKENYIVFVEVKTRGENYRYAPVYAVNKSKQTKLMKTAYLYLKEYPSNKNIRFDIIEIIYSGNKVKSINHIKNAFIQGGSYGSF
ncbi:MAG: YraN family protein [Ruminococcus sp.]